MAQRDDSQNPSDPTGAPPAPSGDPWTADELAQSQQWANQYYTSHQIPASYGTPDDLANSYVAQRRAGASHTDAMAYLQTVPGLLGWDKFKSTDPVPDPPPGPTPPPPGPTQTPPDIYNAPLTKPYGGTFTPPGSIDLGGPSGISYIPKTPTFTDFPTLGKAPGFSYEDFKPGQFTAPSVADALNDPGYQFRKQQGESSLQNWAAARGTLNDSSTAKALEDYGQDAGSQEYANVWNRDLNAFQTNEGERFGAYNANRAGAVQAYNTNYQTQYTDPYQASLSNYITGTVNPAMTAYSTQAAAGANQNGINYQNAWSQFLNGQDQYNNWQDRAFNKIFQTASY